MVQFLGPAADRVDNRHCAFADTGVYSVWLA